MSPRSSRYDEDDDDYEPRRRRRRSDDDDDDFPRRHRRPPTSSSVGLWIGLGIGGAVLLMAGLMFVLLRSRPAPPPEFGPPPFAFGGPAQPLEVAPPLAGALGVNGNSLRSFFVSGGPAGHGVAVTGDRAGGGAKLTVFPLLGRGNGTDGVVETPLTAADQVVASNDGTRIAVVESAPGRGDVVHVYTVGAGAVAAFTPYPTGAARGGELSWVCFIPDGRLLTINSTGGYDVWSFPGFQRQHGRGGALRNFGELRMNRFTHAPTNFAVTADGGKVVLSNGAGFTVYDTATGNKLIDLEPATAPGAICNHWAAAVNADGTRFAYMLSNNSENPSRGPRLMVWDVTTGKRLTDAGVGNNTPAGMGWWGDRHLLGWQGGMGTATVYDATTGQIVGSVAGNGVVKMAPLTPSNQLHVLATEFNRGTVLVNVDAPNNPRNGMRVGVNGLEN